MGTNITGSSSLGNGDGGVVLFTASSTTIGGGAGLGNIIAFNAGLGAVVNIGTGNTIFANSIHSNGGLGIDLGFNGVTPNDPLDADSGTNNLQNYPVIGTAANTGTGTFVAGSLNSAPNQTYTIEFFSNTLFDPPGYGEGQTFLGAINATTAADGNVILNVTLPLTVPAGQYITTTATDASGKASPNHENPRSG